MLLINTELPSADSPGCINTQVHINLIALEQLVYTVPFRGGESTAVGTYSATGPYTPLAAAAPPVGPDERFNFLLHI